MGRGKCRIRGLEPGRNFGCCRAHPEPSTRNNSFKMSLARHEGRPSCRQGRRGADAALSRGCGRVETPKSCQSRRDPEASRRARETLESLGRLESRARGDGALKLLPRWGFPMSLRTGQLSPGQGRAVTLPRVSSRERAAKPGRERSSLVGMISFREEKGGKGIHHFLKCFVQKLLFSPCPAVLAFPGREGFGLSFGKARLSVLPAPGVFSRNSELFC